MRWFKKYQIHFVCINVATKKNQLTILGIHENQSCFSNGKFYLPLTCSNSNFQLKLISDHNQLSMYYKMVSSTLHYFNILLVIIYSISSQRKTNRLCEGSREMPFQIGRYRTTFIDPWLQITAVSLITGMLLSSTDAYSEHWYVSFSGYTSMVTLNNRYMEYTFDISTIPQSK